MSLSAIRVPAVTKPATAAVIFFHGLGDSGSGWKFFADMARSSPDFDHINFVFPNAPTAPITVNGGMEMSSWFDIQRFGEWTNNKDVAGYLKSLDKVGTYIEEQIKQGIKPERIVVGGFSQGGGLALGTAALYPKKLAAIIAFSPAVPFFSLLKEKTIDVNKNTPVFHGHGTADPIVPISAGVQDHKLFTELGFKDYTFKTYGGLEHSCDPNELREAFDLIKRVLA